MKGFKKDGKFRPTEKKSKSTLKKSDVRKKQTVGVNEVNSLLRTKGSVQNEKEAHDKRVDYEYDRFLQQVSDYGSGDISNAIDKADEVGIGGSELSDLVREFSDDTETPLEDVDINAVLYEHILGIADRKIETLTGFRPVDEGFYVAGNYLATTYDYTTEGQAELLKAIRKLSVEHKTILRENRFTKSFLEDVDIEV